MKAEEEENIVNQDYYFRIFIQTINKCQNGHINRRKIKILAQKKIFEKNE